MTRTSPTIEDALHLYDLGLAVIPAVADDGKSVEGVVANFGKWRNRPSRRVTEKLFRQHPGANIAILPYLCRPRLVVVDCDATAALTAAEREYGPTPLMIRTPRRAGWHRYYRAPDGPVRQLINEALTRNAVRKLEIMSILTAGEAELLELNGLIDYHSQYSSVAEKILAALDMIVEIDQITKADTART